MKIERIELHYVCLPFLRPFQYSSGTEVDHPCIIVAVYSEELVGWGECPVYYYPYYCYETIQTAWHILSDCLIPAVIGENISSPAELSPTFKRFRGHPLAKSALDCAFWDLFAKQQGIPLSKMLGGQRTRVEAGVSIGIQPTIDELLQQVEDFTSQGYQRIKLKIAPGWEIKPLTAIRERYPELKLMVDANSAFNLDDLPLFEQMEQFNLLMIEQPLHHDDIINHAKLQAIIKTPLCLDESIKSPDDARTMIELKAAHILNLKICRVGGLTNALEIHQICLEAGIPMWCGGMEESGVGRATNVHLATLPNFVFPGDISENQRFFAEDLVTPLFQLNQEDSTITVPATPGIGVEIVKLNLEKMRKDLKVFTA